MSDQEVYSNRRNYNRWVANQTLEDYALRFTAKSARLWSISRVANTALGAISFLALEAIGGAITLSFGFTNAAWAIVIVSLAIFISGAPITYYATKYGVDIDLLSRGAGFGYIGSTITSLIYASFTFIFFALEAVIMASALEMLFGLPMELGYLISSLVVIPLVTHGISLISRFQLWTQPFWVILQILPFTIVLWGEAQSVSDWTRYQGTQEVTPGAFNILLFGAASCVLFSLMAQIGEQVDFLRFMPVKTQRNSRYWWLSTLAAGPGWIVIGALKLFLGSYLAVWALGQGVPFEEASSPPHMYQVAFQFLFGNPTAALAVTGIFVILCQLKINVTNAYAGSIAWSNFFSRLTHSHPGRVVWLVFNVFIALLIMELGIYGSLEKILGVYSNVAVAWVGALVADLVINKPLGLSPRHIEFKRAYLYDINPVGVGSMVVASAIGIVCYVGVAGDLPKALAPFISLFTAFVLSPVIAKFTHGRYYLAREQELIVADTTNAPFHVCECVVCQNHFEVEDMAYCPAYDGYICSLCCSLDARCHDQCKTESGFSDQITRLVGNLLPTSLVESASHRLLQFFGYQTLISLIVAGLFWLVYMLSPFGSSENRDIVGGIFIQVYVLLSILIGVMVWIFVLANESRMFALQESRRQTELLRNEIIAHNETDLALQKAKEVAEAANHAKSRYLTGISHELRTPLNSILGYAQLLERDNPLSQSQSNKISIIRRGAEHLSDIIEGLLDISRIEAGRLEIKAHQVNFSELINDLVSLFGLQARKKGIGFECRFLSAIPTYVKADEKQLRQILTNLLSNAVKYTQQGKVVLSISYRTEVAVFKIIDTGMGISDDNIETIFKPFERIREPHSPQVPGTGLGLTITKLLTEIMGGDLKVESEHGAGSCFQVSLMLPRADNLALTSGTELQPVAYKSASKVVMVVDDEPAHRGLISEILTPLGFVVAEACGAEECLKVVESQFIDLFLLDIEMPGTKGIELARQLRLSDIKSPIIMVSANASETAERIEGNFPNEIFYSDYISKPLRENVLLDKISQHLKVEWQYDKKPALSADKPSHFTIADSILTESAIRQLIANADVGYFQGVDDILSKFENNQKGDPLVAALRGYLVEFKFAEISHLCVEALGVDQ